MSNNIELELQIIEVSYKNLKKFERLLNLCEDPNSMKVQISDANNTVEVDYCSLFDHLLMKDICKLVKNNAIDVIKTSRRNIIDSCNTIIGVANGDKT